MSFYSVKNPSGDICPGRIRGDSSGVIERVCIQANKVYDACMQQETLSNVPLTLANITPPSPAPVPPLTFVSCSSSSVHGVIHNLSIQRLTDRPNFARVQAMIDIPINVVFTDSTNTEFVGSSTITVAKDVIMYVPPDSIVPFELDNTVSAICVNGIYATGTTFTLSLCVTVILKIVANVDLLVPAYGFCRIPPCEEFAENVCDEFFALPLFPPQIEDCNVCQ